MAMRAALRILTAMSYGNLGNIEDLRRLREYAPDLAHLAENEFAREVIHRILAIRRQASESPEPSWSMSQNP